MVKYVLFTPVTGNTTVSKVGSYRERVPQKKRKGKVPVQSRHRYRKEAGRDLTIFLPP